MMSLAQQARGGAERRHARHVRRRRLGGRAAAHPAYEPWPAAERLQQEYDAVGFFLSGHPLDEYGDLLQEAAACRAGSSSAAP